MYDVAVIGGGPAGSQAAYRLAGMGYGVVVVEQRDRLCLSQNLQSTSYQEIYMELRIFM